MRTPLVLVIIVIIASLLIDWGIWRNVKLHAKRKQYSKIYLVSSVICWVILIAALLYPKRDSDSDILPIMWILYYYAAVYIAKLVILIFILIGKIPKLWNGKSINTGLWCGLPLGILVIITAVWGACITRREIDVEKVTIYSSKLPEPFDGYRIVQFSDIHVGTWGKDTSFVSELVDSINAQAPDLIVFTGDIVNRKTSELEPFIDVLSRLHAKDGVFSVLGNHDYGDYISWDNPKEKVANLSYLKELQKKMGWKMLNNSFETLNRNNEEIELIGVENWGEPPFKQYGDLKKAYPVDSARNLKDGRYKILLSHNPEHWRREVLKESNVDLTLSGHTHAMQLMIKFGSFRWSPSKYRYSQWGGLYEKLNNDGVPTSLYVNIGSGEVGIPARIGAIPEITVITLRRGKN